MAVNGVFGAAFALVAPVQDHLLELVPEEVIQVNGKFCVTGLN
jgi:hypothetical protein